jgi:hypothetical protein
MRPRSAFHRSTDERKHSLALSDVPSLLAGSLRAIRKRSDVGGANTDAGTVFQVRLYALSGMNIMSCL